MPKFVASIFFLIFSFAFSHAENLQSSNGQIIIEDIINNYFFESSNKLINHNILSQRAYLYARFRNDIDIISQMEIKSENDIQSIRDILFSYNQIILSQSFQSYCALIILNDKKFTKELLKLQKKLRLNNADFDFYIRKNPEVMLKFTSVNDSLRLIDQISFADSERISQIGFKIKKIASEINVSSWGVKKIKQGEERVEDSKLFGEYRNMIFSQKLQNLSMAENDHLKNTKKIKFAQLKSNQERLFIPTFSDLKNIDAEIFFHSRLKNINGLPGYNFAVSKNKWSINWSNLYDHGIQNKNKDIFHSYILRLAALKVINRLNNDTIYAYSNQSQRCMQFSYLSFEQCLSASYSTAEELFCIAEHGIISVSKCINNMK